ncbi:MAG: type I pullulanase, partial [Oscillospiraceae bacterium]
MESTKAIDYGRPFDARFYYNGRDLGARWTPSRTIFKLWSPEAERVELSLYPDGVSAAGATLPLQQGDRGVWSLALDGDLHGVYYDYTVTMGGEARATADPYAAACCRNGARSMVIDLARAAPEGFERDVPPPLQTEQVICGLDGRGFS